MEPREFIRCGVMAGSAALIGGVAGATDASRLELGGDPVPRRPLGRTGFTCPLITYPGIAVMNLDQSLANDLVAEAIDHGVNQFDVAPTYGNAELVLAAALKGRRDEVFLGCKTEKRTAAEAAEALDETLRRFDTDHVELYQVHAIGSMDDVEHIFGPGGAMETFMRAKQEGKARLLGITVHDPTAALEALRRYDFDTVMFPINFAIRHHSDYGVELLAEANRRGLGVFAIKPMATRNWAEGEKHTSPNCWYKPASSIREVDLALRWALSEPISSAVTAGDWKLFRKALITARRFRPLDDAERAELDRMAAQIRPIFPQG